MATIGKVIDIPWERDFEWRIEGFSTLSTEDDKYYHSFLFYFASESWYLRLYPNGEKKYESIGYIAVYLVRQCSGPPISLDFSYNLKTMDGKIDQEWHTSYVFEEADEGWGFPKFLERSRFLEKKSELGLPDVFTLICTVKCLECTHYATSKKMQKDFKAVMLSGDFSDILIKVKGEEFPLHRAILAARNSYFHSMLTSDMREKNTGVVSIDDWEPDLFRIFVHFLYTGKVEKLTPENVCELYEMSDMYQEDELKKICLHFMMNTLSEDTFCNHITLALKYDEKKLLEKAIELFTSKPYKIASSAKWLNIL